jgi:hypothetical protein
LAGLAQNELWASLVLVCAAWKIEKLGCLVVNVMTMVAMVMRSGERRGGTHHNQKHCSKDLLHRLNVA